MSIVKKNGKWYVYTDGGTRIFPAERDALEYARDHGYICVDRNPSADKTFIMYMMISDQW
jgi:hypothetical protein